MSIVATKPFSSVVPDFKGLTPQLYTAPDEAVALVLTFKTGGVLLTSHYGSNVAAYPLRKNSGEDPDATCRRYLEPRGFKIRELPSANSEEYLAEVMQSAGFSMGQVQQAMRLC